MNLNPSWAKMTCGRPLISEPAGLRNNRNFNNMQAIQHTRSFPYIDVEPTFVGRRQHLKNLEDYTKDVPSRYLSRQGFVYWITGIEGIGKSRLVHRFIENLINRNDGREFLWFDCKDQQTLFEQFSGAARAHRITLRSINLKGLEQMYVELSKNEKLIVFDNVQSFDDIEEYLPKSTFGKFTVIATCRYLHPKFKPRRISLSALDLAESKELVFAVNSPNVIQSINLNEEAIKTAIKFSNGIPSILKDMVDFARKCAHTEHILGNDKYNVQTFFNTWAGKKYLLKSNDVAQEGTGPISTNDRFTEIMKDLLATIEQRAATTEVQQSIVQILTLISFLLPLAHYIPKVLLFNFLELDKDMCNEAIGLLSQHFILTDKSLYLQIDGAVQRRLAKVLWENKTKHFETFLETFCSRMQFCIDKVGSTNEIGETIIKNRINALKERREKLNIEPEIELVQCLVKKVRFIFPEENVPLDSSLDTLAEFFVPSNNFF